MRMRATRTGATGCNARRLGLTIGQLLPAGAGRVAAIYTDPARPSYDECIQQNRKALGPERVPQSAYLSSTGWQLSPGIAIAGERAVATAAAQFGIAGYYQAVVPGQTYFVTTIVDSVAAGSVRPVLLGGSQVSGAARTAPGIYFDFLQAVAGNDRFAVQFNGAGSNTATARVFAQEIADWSKCVLFDDANGTVPIFSVLQSARGRGLLLDRSQGLVRGAELVVNGTFDSSTAGWSGQAATLSQVAGSLSVEAFSGAGGAYQDVPTVAERWYEITASVLSDVSASLKVYVGGAFTTLLYDGPAATTARPIRAIFKATSSSSRVYLRNTGTSTVLYDNVSVRELPGNHMSQPTAAARGVFEARYNRLTNTSFLLGSVGAVPTDWIERGNVTGRIVEDAASPSGRAMRVTVSVGGGIAASSDVRCPASGLVPGAATRARVLAKRVSGAAAAGWAAALSSGTLTLTDQYAWYSLDFSATSEGNGVFLGGTNPIVYDVAAIDLRPVADFIPSIPDFQRVTSPTDYDDVGFPVYHRQQTDDWARTRINPNGATKAVVLVAVQKMSDAAIGCLLEATDSGASSIGSVTLFGPSQLNSSTYLLRSRGSGQADLTVTGFQAPARHAILGTTLNNPGTSDVVQMDINGVFAGSSPTNHGDGGYLEKEYFLGARGGTSLFENTRQFAPLLLIFCQSADTINPSHVARLQKAYAKAAGVTL